MDLVEHGLLDQQQQNHAMPVEVVESSPKDRSGATVRIGTLTAPAGRHATSPATLTPCVICAMPSVPLLRPRQTTAALPEDVMPCPNIRHLLAPRPSPFVVHNNYGGGFVHDNDLVTLQALK